MQSNFKADLAIEQGRKELNRFIIESITREKITEECNDYRYDFKLSNEKTVEVKNMEGANKTGNLTIETQGNKGKPSGLTTSEADYWLITYSITEKEYGIIFIPTGALKRINKMYENNQRIGKEGSKVTLLPVSNEYIQRYNIGSFAVSNHNVFSISFKTELVY